MWIAFLFGGLTLAVQTLLLRQFLWHFEAAGLGVGVFVATWLAWTGAGAALARTRGGRPVVLWLAAQPGLACLALSLLACFEQAALVRLRGWLGVPEHLSFPMLRLSLGCLLVNAPFCLLAGLVFSALCRRVAVRGRRVTHAFAAEALGAAVAGAVLVALLAAGIPLDGGGTAAWRRVFRRSAPEGRFVTPAGSFVHGVDEGTFYVLGAGGIREMLPERDRSFELAALLLAQRPYAVQALALGRVPLAVCLAVAELQPGCRVTWCPDDPAYARAIIAHERARRPGGAADRVIVPGVAPGVLLATVQPATFNVAWVVPPHAASAAGAGWWQPQFLAGLRAALAPDGVAAVSLGLEGLARTTTGRALLANQVDAVTGVWPECGRLVAGAGGWWLACARHGGLFDADAAAERFALLHAAALPPQVVLDIYSPSRAADLARGSDVPVAVETPLIVPLPRDRSAAVRWLSLAAGFRREWPGATGCDQWMLRRLDRGAAACVPLMLLLAGLWVLPVAAGRRSSAGRRARLAWLAATGFLGLATLLGLMQTLETRFGSLYLLAGLASACYLIGLFAGNRGGAALGLDAQPLKLATVTAFQLAATWLIWRCAVRLEPSAGAVVVACGLCALPAGAAVSVAGGGREEDTRAAPGAGMLLADAWGSALGGLLFAAVLLPCLGGADALQLVALLTVGVAACALAPAAMVRFAATVACVACLLTGGFAWRADLRTGAQQHLPAAAATVSEMPSGRTRPVDLERVRRLWATRELATHPADFWEPESPPAAATTNGPAQAP